MTTITREQQKQILIDTANHVISRDNTSPYSENLRELARIALASLEEKPVGEVSEKRYGLVMDGTVDLGGESTYRIIKGEKAMKRLPLGTKFYIAPPVLVVPEEIEPDSNNTYDYVDGWNACRAAMLQGKSEQPQNAQQNIPENIPGGNSPVIPDGWISRFEEMPDPSSEKRVCAFTPTNHEDMRYRFVPASLFKTVCRDATHWFYMLPPVGREEVAGG